MFSKPTRSVDRIFIHCTASDHAHHDNVAAIRDMHVNGNGWSDIGYHLFVRKSGQLEAGRPLSRIPAAQGGHNTGTIAICLHGLREDLFTEAQFDTLRTLAVEINNAYDGKVTFHGHREVAAKACPVFDYKKVLKLDSFGRLGLTGAAAQPVKEADGMDPDTLPDLEQGDRGPAVALLQKLLLIKDDGIFGPKTANAVRDFKTAQGLFRSDQVVSHVWRLLIDNQQVEHSD